MESLGKSAGRNDAGTEEMPSAGRDCDQRGDPRDDERRHRAAVWSDRFGQLCRCWIADLERIDPDRLFDVLEPSGAEIGHLHVEPAAYLTIGVLGETDRAGCGDALKPGCDVDAVAHQIAVELLDDVAEMNTNPEFDAALGRQAGVTLDHAVLYFDRAAHGIDDAAESMRLPSPVRLTMRP